MEWLILMPSYAYIAFWDYKDRIIPNMAILVIVLGALIYHLHNNQLSVFMGGFLGCFMVLYIFYAVGGMNAGDVKLAMATGAVLGYWSGIQLVLLAILLANLYIVVIKIRKKQLKSFVRQIVALFKLLFKTGNLRNYVVASTNESLPLGVFFLPAGLIYFGIERWLLF